MQNITHCLTLKENTHIAVSITFITISFSSLGFFYLGTAFLKHKPSLEPQRFNCFCGEVASVMIMLAALPLPDVTEAMLIPLELKGRFIFLFTLKQSFNVMVFIWLILFIPLMIKNPNVLY